MTANVQLSHAVSWLEAVQAYWTLSVCLHASLLESIVARKTWKGVDLRRRETGLTTSVEGAVPRQDADLAPTSDDIIVLYLAEVPLGNSHTMLQKPSNDTESKMYKDPDIAQCQPED